MSMMMELLSSVFERRYRPISKDEMDNRSISTLLDKLIQATGEDSKVLLATQVLDRFELMDDQEKCDFFIHLSTTMDIEPDKIEKALAIFREQPSRKNYQNYLDAVDPNRQEIIRRLNQVSGATEKLVNMRADLLKFLPQSDSLSLLDLDFRHLFSSWFNRGFLVLRPINWETPANILEKIIAYEAVHAIDSWDDLRLRMQPEDRCCFAFFHLSMPDEPLIFVEVALTQGIANSVQDVLSDAREVVSANEADTAVFYSISNCQQGLSSISFGNSLIKQVVAELAETFPNLKNFVTLSPIPGLMNWVKAVGLEQQVDLDDMRPLAAHYLMNAKISNGKPVDPVARFHLNNGAKIHGIHNEADTSAKGIEQSGKAMVNYLYDLKTVSANHEKFAAEGRIFAAQEVVKLSKSIKFSEEDRNV